MGIFIFLSVFHKNSMTVTATVPALASLGDAKLIVTFLFLWHRIRTLDESSHSRYCGNFHFKVMSKKFMTVTVLALALLGDATQIETILFVSHRKMNCRQVQSSLLLWAFSLAKCFSQKFHDSDSDCTCHGFLG